MGKINYDSGDIAAIIFFTFIAGMFVMGIFDCIGWAPITHISQDTMNTICQKLNPDGKIMTGHLASGGKLVCEYPSYDNTQNIIFKSNANSEPSRTES